MAFVSITRLHLRAWRVLPGFLVQTFRAAGQARRSGGYVAGALSADMRRLTFWTLTLWKDQAAMRGYQHSGAHKAVMPRIGDWCDEAAVAHWEQDGGRIPGGDEALERMQRQGRVVKLPQPSQGHAAGETVPDGRPPRFKPMPAP